MFGLGTWEILMILIAALVFIGPSKLPGLARTMGKGMRDVKRAMAGFEDEVRQASTVPLTPEPSPPTEDPDTDAVTDDADPEGTVEETVAHHASPEPPVTEADEPQPTASPTDTASSEANDAPESEDKSVGTLTS